MVVKKYFSTRKDGVNLFRTYSDEGLKIRKSTFDSFGNKVETDQVFNDAIDVESAPFIYDETDIPIDRGDELGIQQSDLSG